MDMRYLSMNENDILAVLTTLKLASFTTFILILFGTPLSWWLSQTRWRYKVVLEALLAMPLVLPPTVLGFYLLVAMGESGPLGGFAKSFGFRPFTFSGLVIGSYCSPNIESFKESAKSASVPGNHSK